MKRKIQICLLLAVCLLILCACAGSPAQPATEPTETEAVSVDLTQLYSQMAEKLPQMIEMDQDMMLDYCGIDAQKCVQTVVTMNYNGLETDEIWLLEAVDSAAADTLEEMAQLRLKMKAEETETYAPDQYAVVQKAQLLRKGNYLALIVTPEAAALSEMFNTALGK